LSNSRFIDGFGPLPVARPSSVPELSELVREAAAGGQALYPVGGETMLDYGLPPTKPGTAVELGGLDRVIDYPARDMTITVQAGITVSRLQEVLRAEGQQLPVDVPLPDQATLGGAVATNASGPRRFGYGTLRDYVIGITVVNDEGQEIKAGGRVVKNVAGYDLMKLYTGSLGTLGIITQLTLKVKPLPEASRWLTIECDPDEVPGLLTRLNTTRTRPCALTIWGRGKEGRVRGGVSVVIAFEDSVRAVEWQVARLNEELHDRVPKALRELDDRRANELATALRDSPLVDSGALTFKGNVLAARTWDFCQQAATGGYLGFTAHAGNGIIIGHIAETIAETARAYLDELGRFAGECSGNVVVLRCPSAWKSVLPVWGRSTPDRVLMRAVKDKMDPGRVFNPGRFVDGV
jgi:glycolate dehydrogenase FAD-binding subunit